jgi:hypothetical protein
MTDNNEIIQARNKARLEKLQLYRMLKEEIVDKNSDASCSV